MKALTRISLGVALTGMLVLAGCNLAGGSDSGTLSLSLTDAPINASNVDGVYITITGVEYNRDGTWSEMSGFDGPKQYNLLDLTGGESALIGDLTLPSGEYTQIRFMLDVAEQGGSGPPSNPGSYVSFSDDTDDAPLFVPSGGQTGYKASADEPFLVPQNGTVSITADFNVGQAVVKLGSTGNYILKPVLRLIVDDQAGHIAGDVDYTGSNSLVVFAYEDGTWDSSETSGGEESNAFGNAVTSSTVEDTDDDDNLDYTLAFLAEGTYDIVSAEFDENGDYVSGSVNARTNADQSVTAGETASLDISH